MSNQPLLSASQDSTAEELFDKLLEPNRSQTVLEVGTGQGETAFKLAKHVKKVVAIDCNSARLEAARRQSEKLSPGNVTFMAMDAKNLDFPKNTFDRVVCVRSFHHFQEPEKILAEIVRVLRPGGRLIIDDSMSPHEPILDHFLNRLRKLRDSSCVRDYTEREWIEMLELVELQPVYFQLVKRTVDIASWLEGVDAERVAKIYDHFACASPICKVYFDVESKNGRAVSYAFDRLLMRVDKE